MPATIIILLTLFIQLIESFDRVVAVTELGGHYDNWKYSLQLHLSSYHVASYDI